MASTGWTIDEYSAAPFCDVVDLAEWFAEHPPGTAAGIELERPMNMKPNPLESIEAVRRLSGSARAAKLSTAPEIDRLRFEQLKEMAAKNAG